MLILFQHVTYQIHDNSIHNPLKKRVLVTRTRFFKGLIGLCRWLGGRYNSRRLID